MAEQLETLYDTWCKNVLAESDIVGNILQTCVTEYEHYTVEQIVRDFLREPPEIGMVSVSPEGDVTKLPTQNTEDASTKDGTVFYDIRMNVLAPSGDGIIRLIINIEAQNRLHEITLRKDSEGLHHLDLYQSDEEMAEHHQPLRIISPRMRTRRRSASRFLLKKSA